jgi:hypothetical protein
MESALHTALIRATNTQNNGLRYINSVGIMKTDDLDDMLDGINSYNLSRHIEAMKSWKDTKDWKTFCDELIALNNRTYANRFHPSEDHIRQQLVALRTGCKQLIDSL